MPMKKTMLAVAAVAAAVLGCASKPDAERPLKVLMIGNSFSICNLREMPNVAAAMDRKLDLASLYIGGCSLARHWSNTVASAANAELRQYRFDRTVDGLKTVENGKSSIQEALALDKWDVVTLQQASHFSWRPRRRGALPRGTSGWRNSASTRPRCIPGSTRHTRRSPAGTASR